MTWANVPMQSLTPGAPAASAPLPPPPTLGRVDSVLVGSVRFHIVGPQIMMSQAVQGTNVGPGLETVIGVLTPPRQPVGLSVINGVLMVDIGEAVVTYDVREPSHPVPVSGPMTQTPQSYDGERPNNTPPPPAANRNRKSNNLLIATGVLMGLAAICGLLCIIPGIWVCMLTPVALFFVAGLICMIIGLAIRKK